MKLGYPFYDRVGVWNEELNVPLDAGDAQSCSLQLAVVDATLQEEGLKACTFQLGDFVPWNGYHLNVRQPSHDLSRQRFRYPRTQISLCLGFGPVSIFQDEYSMSAQKNTRARNDHIVKSPSGLRALFPVTQVHMGRDIRLRVSIVVALEDPVVEIQHLLHLEALLLTFPEGMPLPGVRREAGATVKSFVQCIPKVGPYFSLEFVTVCLLTLDVCPLSCTRPGGVCGKANLDIFKRFTTIPRRPVTGDGQ